MVKRIFTLLLLVGMLFLGILFAQANGSVVVVDYYFGVVESELALALLGSMIVGLLVGVTVGLTLSLKQRLQLRQQNQRLKQLEQELDNLRALPVRSVD